MAVHVILATGSVLTKLMCDADEKGVVVTVPNLIPGHTCTIYNDGRSEIGHLIGNDPDNRIVVGPRICHGTKPLITTQQPFRGSDVLLEISQRSTALLQKYGSDAVVAIIVSPTDDVKTILFDDGELLCSTRVDR